MKQLLSLFLKSDGLERQAKEHYASLVTAARAPELYEKYLIPDTLDGRFEAIIIHLFIEEKRMESSPNPEWLRLLHESFFADMDRSLREGGIGDTGISKRVKRMAEAFYGRLSSYQQTLGDDEAFSEALMRNAYRESEADMDKSTANSLAKYIRNAINQ